MFEGIQTVIAKALKDEVGLLSIVNRHATEGSAPSRALKIVPLDYGTDGTHGHAVEYMSPLAGILTIHNADKAAALKLIYHACTQAGTLSQTVRGFNFENACHRLIALGTEVKLRGHRVGHPSVDVRLALTLGEGKPTDIEGNSIPHLHTILQQTQGSCYYRPRSIYDPEIDSIFVEGSLTDNPPLQTSTCCK